MSAALKLDPSSMSEAEWTARVELAALYHVCNDLGWTDTINTHMSARIPGEPNNFLINRYGEMFDEITASSLVKMDMQGNVIGEQGRFNMAGFTIHSGVYKAQPAANCVLHTHTRAGGAVSLIKDGLRPISQDALHVIDDVAYHDYGVPSSVEECEQLGVTAQKGSCVILMNHGLLTWGQTIHGALIRLWYLERACELEMMGRMMGVEPVVVEPFVQQKAKERMTKMRATEAYGRMEYEGMVRTAAKKAKGAIWAR